MGGTVRAEGAADNAQAFREAAVSTVNDHPIAAAELLPDIAHFIEAP